VYNKANASGKDALVVKIIEEANENKEIKHHNYLSSQ